MDNLLYLLNYLKITEQTKQKVSSSDLVTRLLQWFFLIVLLKHDVITSIERGVCIVPIIYASEWIQGYNR